MSSSRPSKRRRVQPNLQRATSALERLLGGDEPDGSGDGKHGGKTVRRGKTRKQLRKARKEDKKKRVRAHQAAKARRKTQARAQGEGKAAAAAAAPCTEAAATKKRKRKKGGAPSESTPKPAAMGPSLPGDLDGEGPNANFFSLLREQNLIGGGDGADPEDDEIRAMERRLKLKGADKEAAATRELAGTGLDYLLAYKDDVPEHARVAPGGAGGASDAESDAFDLLGQETSSDEEYLEDDGGQDSDGDAAMELGGDGDEGESSGAEEADEREAVLGGGPVSYISRAEAYGDKGPSSGGKYVPPAQRARLAAMQGEVSVEVKKRTRGLLNRLNQSNFASIVKSLEELFQTRSRNEMNQAIFDFIADTCINAEKTSMHLLSVYTALVASLNNILGTEVGAYFAQRLVEYMRDSYAEAVAEAGTAPEGVLVTNKKAVNSITMFGLLYNFKMLHSKLLFEQLQTYLTTLGEVDLELILVVMTTSGAKLRRDDAVSCKEFLRRVHDRARETSATRSARAGFIVQSLEEIASARGKSLRREKGADPHEAMLKIIRSVSRQRDLPLADPFRVSIADLLDADRKGRWWLVGSAWAGRDEGELQASAKSTAAPADADEPALSDGIASVAVQQRMNTDLRRRIFATIMESEDYLDAFDRVLRLKLKAKQDRGVIHVLVDCCLQGKAYNPFYFLLAQKLCEHNFNHKFTVQYTYWDKLKVMDSLTVLQSSNLAKLIAALIASFSLSLAVLKTVSFSELQEETVFHLQLLFALLLTHNSEGKVTKIFQRVAGIEDLVGLRGGILIFMKHYMGSLSVGLGDGEDSSSRRGDAGQGGGGMALADRKRVLRKRIKLVRRLFALSSA